MHPAEAKSHRKKNSVPECNQPSSKDFKRTVYRCKIQQLHRFRVFKVVPSSVQSTPSTRNVLIDPTETKCHTSATIQFQSAKAPLFSPILNRF